MRNRNHAVGGKSRGIRKIEIPKAIRDHRPQPLILKCRWMRKGYCLNLFGILCARDTSWIDLDVINHERIHNAQMRELLWLPFYLLYILEWVWLLIRYRDSHKAYLNISFEREAYRHGHDPGYLKRRRRFASFRNESL